MTEIKKVVVLGSGVLGSQIAYQSVYSGCEVAVYDIKREILDKAEQGTFPGLADTYVAEVKGATREKVDAALGRVSYHDDLATAAADADIVIEAVPEVLKIKQDTFAKLNEVAPAKTIFATNSSTLLPSEIAPSSGRPDRFLAMHFANRVWQFNTAEIMGTPDTDKAVFDRVVEFAKPLGMVPIPMHRDKAGYVLNSLLVPFLEAAAKLYMREIASIEDVDKTWRISTGSPMGPFQIYDIVGMMTPYMLNKDSDDPEMKAFADKIKSDFIDKGYLGTSTGRGFYTYG